MNEALLRRIEAGEPPTDAELAQLRTAAVRGGPDERLALAHALLNAEAEPEARPLVAGLLRDAPDDPRVPLLHARLLGADERWPELHTLLLREERRRPEDPEVQKGLALAELRRGEVRSARRRVAAVRALDPFDGEAKLLEAELDACELPEGLLRSPAALVGGAAPEGVGAARDGAAPVLPAELHEAVALPEDELAVVLAEAVAPRGVRAVAVEGGLVLRLGRARVRVGLAPLARRLAGAADWRAEARLVAATLAARLQDDRPEPARLLAEVLPVLRGPAFAARISGAARAPGPAGLAIYFVLEDPELVRHVPESWLGAGLTLAALQEAAFANLDARSAPLRPVDLRSEGLRLAAAPTGLWALAAGDGHDGARLLSRSQRPRLEAVAAGPWLVRFPSRELVLLAPERDPEAALALAAAKSRDDEAIAGIYRWAAGALQSLA